jgi:streptomycin 6-kinase
MLLRELADAGRERWGLRLGEPYAPGAVGYAVRVELPDGTPAVLKVSAPDRESEHEGDALALWDGDGAVRLLARDPALNALLLERCEPGTPLSRLDADGALDVMVELLPRLWKPAAEPFRPLAEEAAHWIERLRADGASADRSLVDAAVRTLEELAATQGEQVLVHQDLHADNVLAAQREPWLAIDPKPLVGERELAAAPIVRSFELGHSKRDALHRLDRLSGELGLDRERVRGWTIGQTVAWSSGSYYVAQHIETVRWLLEA